MSNVTIDVFLTRLAQLEGTDLFLTVGAQPAATVHGKLMAIADRPLVAADLESIVAPLLLSPRAVGFSERPDLDVSWAVPGFGRFRVNVCRQRGELAIVARRVRNDVPKLESLGLPKTVEALALARAGLVLVVGATGSGKSTTLAALVGHRNARAGGHIVTIEDPIEFVHEHARSIVTQREVGIDTATYADGLKSALRQAPDVLLVGEVRDRETAEAALRFAETGALVVSTLHANNTVQAIERFMSLFPHEMQAQARAIFGATITGIVAQRLLPGTDGRSRIPAVEVLLPTPRVRDRVRRGDQDGVREALRDGGDGMQSFDEALVHLVATKQITPEDAVAFADSPNELRLLLRVQAPASAGEAAPTFRLK